MYVANVRQIGGRVGELQAHQSQIRPFLNRINGVPWRNISINGSNFHLRLTSRCQISDLSARKTSLARIQWRTCQSGQEKCSTEDMCTTSAVQKNHNNR